MGGATTFMAEGKDMLFNMDNDKLTIYYEDTDLQSGYPVRKSISLDLETAEKLRTFLADSLDGHLTLFLQKKKKELLERLRQLDQEKLNTEEQLRRCKTYDRQT